MPARPLLQLLRPPNLFTVPGDPLCGALLASHGLWSWRILPCVIVSLSSYCAGLIINDLADFSEDLRDRPTRPLPSRAVSRRTAIALALLFIAIALTAAATVSLPVFTLTAVLLANILWYNLLAKKNPLLAPFAMGLCRGLSLLIGAAAFIPFHNWVFGRTGYQPPGLASLGSYFIIHNSPLLPAATITLYIAAITALARKETSNPRFPPLIGSLIRALLFLQAGFCLAAGGSGWIAALLLLALWPISRLVASRFYAS